MEKYLYPIVKIATLLKSNNFSVPEIFAIDYKLGMVLLEDFGEIHVLNILQKNIINTELLYQEIIELLCEIQKIPITLHEYTQQDLLRELNIFINWYIIEFHKVKLTSKEIEKFFSIWNKILDSIPKFHSVIVLRDFHVQNLMYLLNREDSKRIGILDFQDACSGCPIYDLVSILEDARYTVNFDFAAKMIQYYYLHSDLNKYSYSDVLKCYNILALQRNSRILGVFIRKIIRDSNDSYLKLIPRVIKYWKRDIFSENIFSELRNWFEHICPQLLSD